MKLDSIIDLDGIPSRYYPRFRPRRLVMPVDPNDVHGEARHAIHPFHRKKKALNRLQKSAERRGAIVLAEVPAERTVGDAFRIMLENWESWNASCTSSAVLQTARSSLGSTEKSSMSSAPSFSWCSPHLSRLHQLLRSCCPDALENAQTRTEENVSASNLSCSSLLSSFEVADNADQIWDLLNRTPLTSPAHGALALRGKALVESIALSALYSCHDRLRTLHAQQFLHECTGLLPCGRIALRLGLGQLANVESEVHMWREINILSQRVEEARLRAAQHRERAEKGVTQQRRWYWRAVLKSATGRLKMFPVHRDDIQPRMEWIRQLLYSFIAFLEYALPSSPFSSSLSISSDEEKLSSSGRTGSRRAKPVLTPVEKVVLMLFAPSLVRFMNDQQIIRAAREVLKIEGGGDGETAEKGSSSEAHAPAFTSCSSLDERKDATDGRFTSSCCVRRAIREELKRISTLTAEEKEMANEGTHPLNEAADRRREQFDSSGGAHSMETLRDDLEEKHFELYQGVAVPSVVHATRVRNALKEAQLILQYSPLIHPALTPPHFPVGRDRSNKKRKKVLLNVEQVIRRTVEVHETNPYATLTTGRQQFRPVEYRICRLFYGRYCLGEGKGESLIEAIQMAAQQMVSNYYLRGTLQPLWKVTTREKTKETACPPSVCTSSNAGEDLKINESINASPELTSTWKDGEGSAAQEDNGVVIEAPTLEEDLQF